MVVTFAELTAYGVALRAGLIPLDTAEANGIKAGADLIVMLGKRVEMERLKAAME